MGKSKSSTPPPAKTPAEIAQETVNAQIAARPQAAKAEFGILNNPEFGVEATSRLFEDVRRNVFPNENAVREQLVQNILKQLQDPSGLTPEQQQAITERRGLAQNELTRSLRNRANLGGNLFGGRSQLTEERAVGDLQNQFVEEDVNRQERNRLNNSQLALQVLNLLFPNAGIQTPQFIDPVPSANQNSTANIQARGQDISVEQAALDRRAQLQSALFNSLGKAASTAATFA